MRAPRVHYVYYKKLINKYDAVSYQFSQFFPNLSAVSGRKNVSQTNFSLSGIFNEQPTRTQFEMSKYNICAVVLTFSIIWDV